MPRRDSGPEGPRLRGKRAHRRLAGLPGHPGCGLLITPKPAASRRSEGSRADIDELEATSSRQREDADMRVHLIALSRSIACALALGGAVAALGWSGATAQSSADKYPEKPIKIIVPFAPGGSADIIARVIGQKMTDNWRQPVIVETRPGGATMIGTQAAAKADPDGYTLIIVVSNHVTNPSMQAALPYDTLKDFEPVSLLARAPIVPYVSPSFAPTNVKELVAFAKDKPGTINFGSAGPGSMTHLVAEMLKIQAGIDMRHVVYRGGSPALNDVLAGQIPMTFATVTQALPQYQTGLVRALGVTAAGRYASIPEVVTFREQGFDLVASEWYGLLAPARTPKPIVAKLSAEMRRIMALPNLGERLAAIELVGSSPDELGQFIRNEIERWSPVIKQLGLKAE
jgi:tripartite-type tricarboxylate transporter receptor subunit TctC